MPVQALRHKQDNVKWNYLASTNRGVMRTVRHSHIPSLHMHAKVKSSHNRFKEHTDASRLMHDTSCWWVLQSLSLHHLLDGSLASLKLHSWIKHMSSWDLPWSCVCCCCQIMGGFVKTAELRLAVELKPHYREGWPAVCEWEESFAEAGYSNCKVCWNTQHSRSTSRDNPQLRDANDRRELWLKAGGTDQFE